MPLSAAQIILIILPVAGLLVFLFFSGENNDADSHARFAKSIVPAIMMPVIFFGPFLLVEWLDIGFWEIYGTCMALAAAYFAYDWIRKRPRDK
ncbi:MAG: hypothetical protein RBS08_01990 [Bdellovibrionales bacterium]|jgi:hypothetical protein|nr:hypothetical protein [Bdellovibrionales bacterium]